MLINVSLNAQILCKFSERSMRIAICQVSGSPRDCVGIVTFSSHNTYILIDNKHLQYCESYVIITLSKLSEGLCTTTTQNVCGTMKYLAMITLKKIIMRTTITFVTLTPITNN